ncbi:Thioredoxin domain-containing protein [Psidium guajava]|nr:Thioredoxin domain-containing protein [Psidium guajava]
MEFSQKSLFGIPTRITHHKRTIIKVEFGIAYIHNTSTIRIDVRLADSISIKFVSRHNQMERHDVRLVMQRSIRIQRRNSTLG